MKQLLLSLILVCTSLVATAAETPLLSGKTNTGDKSLIATPVFECESWPQEGIPYFRAKADAFSLHEKPSAFSPVSNTITIDNKSIVSFAFGVSELFRHQKEEPAFIPAGMTINNKVIIGKSLQLTLTPGIIKATKNGTFEAIRVYGKIKSCSEINVSKTKANKEYHFKKGDIIEILLYMAEGQCLYRYKDEVFKHESCFYGIQSLQKESEPITELWVSFKIENKPAGWLQITENNTVLEPIGFLY